MKLLLLSSLFVLFASLPVRAEVWQYVGLSTNGTFIQIDTDSIISNNGSYEYNTLMISTSDNKRFFSREQMLCSKKQTRILILSTLDNHGQVIRSSYIPDDNFRPISVDSLWESVYKFICK